MLTPPRCFLRLVCDVQLAWLLGNATEELALRSSQTIGGLLNATFGNAVELIISVAALRKGMIKLVQVRFGCAFLQDRSLAREIAREIARALLLLSLAVVVECTLPTRSSVADHCCLFDAKLACVCSLRRRCSVRS